MNRVHEPGAIGVIGGSGLYEMDGLEQIERVALDTPYGAPSDAYVTGVLDGRRMVFLPRHGAGHKVLPHEINYRANVWGMKQLGVDRLLSVSAVGSMKEQIVPGHLVLVDQFIDRTRQRASTFYGDGVVAPRSCEQPERDWRSDPSDGLRPLVGLRKDFTGASS